MKCSQCNSEISPHFVNGPHCDAHQGFPNVRRASAADESAALGSRYDAAKADAQLRSCESQLQQFENAVAKSNAVLCMRWGVVLKAFDRENALFKTFYQQVSAGDRFPADSYFDQARLSVDATFFPYYHEHTHFAALSLDGSGPASYGECNFVFEDAAISHRTTVFEDNTLVFCKKNVIPVGQSPPKGYSASWDNRSKLAAAKHHGEINDKTHENQFPAILLKQKGGTDADEFIEVHIYGTLALTAVERFRAPKPKLRDDKVFALRLQRKMREKGITVETI